MAGEPTRLDQGKTTGMLANLDKWEIINGKLQKEFKFKSFAGSLEFINKVGSIAESMDHHPEIFNVYNTVVLKLSTHDVNGLSRLDFEFAARVDLLAPILK